MLNSLTGAIIALQVKDLLETDHLPMTKAERWQLIDQIDDNIDRLQRWQCRCQPGSEAQQTVRFNLQALRLKRFQVWNSFYPAFSTVIRIGAYAG